MAHLQSSQIGVRGLSFSCFCKTPFYGKQLVLMSIGSVDSGGGEGGGGDALHTNANPVILGTLFLG